MPDALPPDQPHTARRRWMAVLARADADDLGEMTVTRCTVRTEAGFVGHAYVAGRRERLAELAALADALLQDPMRQTALLEDVIEPLALMQQAQRDAVAAKAAATRVQFFAMRNMRT